MHLGVDQQVPHVEDGPGVLRPGRRVVDLVEESPAEVFVFGTALFLRSLVLLLLLDDADHDHHEGQGAGEIVVVNLSIIVFKV